LVSVINVGPRPGIVYCTRAAGSSLSFVGGLFIRLFTHNLHDCVIFVLFDFDRVVGSLGCTVLGVFALLAWFTIGVRYLLWRRLS